MDALDRIFAPKRNEEDRETSSSQTGSRTLLQAAASPTCPTYSLPDMAGPSWPRRCNLGLRTSGPDPFSSSAR